MSRGDARDGEYTLEVTLDAALEALSGLGSSGGPSERLLLRGVQGIGFALVAVAQSIDGVAVELAESLEAIAGRLEVLEGLLPDDDNDGTDELTSRRRR